MSACVFVAEGSADVPKFKKGKEHAACLTVRTYRKLAFGLEKYLKSTHDFEGVVECAEGEDDEEAGESEEDASMQEPVPRDFSSTGLEAVMKLFEKDKELIAKTRTITNEMQADFGECPDTAIIIHTQRPLIAAVSSLWKDMRSQCDGSTGSNLKKCQTDDQKIELVAQCVAACFFDNFDFNVLKLAVNIICSLDGSAVADGDAFQRLVPLNPKLAAIVGIWKDQTTVEMFLSMHVWWCVALFDQAAKILAADKAVAQRISNAMALVRKCSQEITACISEVPSKMKWTAAWVNVLSQSRHFKPEALLDSHETPASLGAKTLKDLKEMAAALDISVGTGSSKADVIPLIVAGLKSKCCSANDEMIVKLTSTPNGGAATNGIDSQDECDDLDFEIIDWNESYAAITAQKLSAHVYLTVASAVCDTGLSSLKSRSKGKKLFARFVMPNPKWEEKKTESTGFAERFNKKRRKTRARRPLLLVLLLQLLLRLRPRKPLVL